MAFFNKKEDILNIQLTSYGKRLLRQGKFNAEYFVVLDRGVLYSNEKGDLDKDIDIEDRIKNSTPYLKGGRLVIDIDKALKKANEGADEGYKWDDMAFGGYIGSISSLSGQLSYPLWDINVIKGEIDVDNSGGVEGGEIILKDLYVNIEVDEEGKKNREGESWDYIFKDGSAIRVSCDDVFIEFDELNEEDDLGQFEISFYEIKEEEGVEKKEVLYKNKPLTFIENGLYKDRSNDVEFLDREEVIDYFIDITFDQEIDDRVFADSKDYLRKDDRDNIYINDVNSINYESRFALSSSNIENNKVYVDLKEGNLGFDCDDQ